MDLPGPIQEIDPANLWRARAAEVLREAAIAALRPDVVHVSSLFEGIRHDAATSIGVVEPGVATAVTLYDLIPLLDPENYLTDGRVRRWYLRKLQSLRRADLLLAISQASAAEAVALLEWPEALVPVIGAGVDPAFRPPPRAQRNDALLALRHGLTRRVVLYAGGGDPRKNLTALLDAFVQLEPGLRARHQIAVVGELFVNEAAALEARAAALGLHPDELRLLGYVSDADLVGLYADCAAFVFPSLHEGFGLPVAEAMACGAPVIGSNTSSVPEIIGLPEALFDPREPTDIARVLRSALTDSGFCTRLRAHGIARASAFSWDAVAARTIDALETCRPRRQTTPVAEPTGKPRLACVAPAGNTAIECLLHGLAGRYDVTHVASHGSHQAAPVSADVARASGAWFRGHASAHDRVLHVTYSPADGAATALLRACPGTVLLLCDSARSEGADISVAALYREHGLSAATSAVRDGLVAAATSYPILSEPLSLGQGIIVPDRAMAKTIIHRYGHRAAAAIENAAEPDAEACAAALERFVADPNLGRYRRTTAALARLRPEPPPEPRDWQRVAASLAANLVWCRPRQLLIDVSVLVARDVATGIPGVTRAIAAELITTPPAEFKIELVRMTETGFVTARRFALQFLGLGDALGDDEPITPARGDLFLGLDLNVQVATIQPWFKAARRQGASILFIVYDLLPATMPEMFGPEVCTSYQRWLATVIAIADGLLCISRTVADELRRWIDTRGTERRETMRIGWFHMGTKLPTAALSEELNPEHRLVLDAMRRHRSVLAVGTIEPRKGYRQVLGAFDMLWRRGIDITLTIVANRGWLVEDLLALLDAHPERERRLFWVSGISDGVLAELYRSADLLLAASLGEGFGLPLIEAGQFGLPVLARDLPVFREALEDSATFFDTTDPSELAELLVQWAQSPRRKSTAAGKAAQTWFDSRSQLLQHLDGKWYPGDRYNDRFLWTKADCTTSAEVAPCNRTVFGSG